MEELENLIVVFCEIEFPFTIFRVEFLLRVIFDHVAHPARARTLEPELLTENAAIVLILWVYDELADLVANSIGIDSA